MKNSIFILSILFTILWSYPSFAQKKSKKKKNAKEVKITEQQRHTEANLFVMAVSERELGNLEKSQEMFSKAIEINPEDGAAYYENARVLQAMGRNDEALISAKHALLLDKENKWYKVLYANTSKANGNYDDYVQAYE